LCPDGQRCRNAHSKEEVLFHPDIFKTTLCDESESSSRRSGSKRHRCHRYYCPLAHGIQELRPSSLTAEQIEECLSGLDRFPSDTCCKYCTQPWHIPAQDTRTGTPVSLEQQIALEQQLASMWPSDIPSAAMCTAELWNSPAATSDAADQASFVNWLTDDTAVDSVDPSSILAAAANRRSLGSVGECFNPWQSLSILGDVPAFVDIPEAGRKTFVGDALPRLTSDKQSDGNSEILYTLSLLGDLPAFIDVSGQRNGRCGDENAKPIIVDKHIEQHESRPGVVYTLL